MLQNLLLNLKKNPPAFGRLRPRAIIPSNRPLQLYFLDMPMVSYAVSKSSSNFAREVYRQRLRLKRRGVSPTHTLWWASCKDLLGYLEDDGLAALQLWLPIW